MIDVKPLRQGDFKLIQAHHTQYDFDPDGTQEAELATNGMAWTFWDGDEAIGASGVVSPWEGRRVLWCVLAKGTRKHIPELTEIAKRMLKEYPCHRTECYVAEGFEAGIQWAEAIGFKCETPQALKGFLPSGRSAYIYSIVGD